MKPGTHPATSNSDSRPDKPGRLRSAEDLVSGGPAEPLGKSAVAGTLWLAGQQWVARLSSVCGSLDESSWPLASPSLAPPEPDSSSGT